MGGMVFHIDRGAQLRQQINSQNAVDAAAAGPPDGGKVYSCQPQVPKMVLADRELGFLHPVARSVGGPAVREAATIGGNLFAPSPYGDFATALLALDATATLAGGFGQRELPIEELLGRRDRSPIIMRERKPQERRSGSQE